MKRFSVAVPEALLSRIDALALWKGAGEGRWGYGRGWSRDRTARWLLSEAVRLLEEMNQIPLDPAKSESRKPARVNHGDRGDRGE
jgi:hypothetical protein